MCSIYDKRYLSEIEVEGYDENDSDAVVCPCCGESFTDHNSDCPLYIAVQSEQEFTIEMEAVC